MPGSSVKDKEAASCGRCKLRWYHGRFVLSGRIGLFCFIGNTVLKYVSIKQKMLRNIQCKEEMYAERIGKDL